MDTQEHPLAALLPISGEELDGLTASQRAALAAEVKIRYLGQPRIPGITESTDAFVGRLLKVGESSVRRADRVRREQPEKFRRIKNGELTVTEVYFNLPERPEPPAFSSKRVKHALENIFSTLSGLESSMEFMDLGNSALPVTPDEREQYLEVSERFIRQLNLIRKKLREE